MNHVLATCRPWNEIMARRLEEQTGHTFHLITRKEELTSERLAAIAPRYVFFSHWSNIIPETIHTTYECVIFHMTGLPYGRGGSPLQNLIQRGRHETQLTALRCTAELDAGPVYMKRFLRLEGAACEILLRAAVEIETMIGAIIRDEPEPQPQKGGPVTFRRRTPDESNLRQVVVQDVNEFFDFIGMLDAEGYPRAFLDLHSHRTELSRVRREHDGIVGTFVIYRQNIIPDKTGGRVKALLDRCYSKPPRDVFERMLALYRPGDPFYTVEQEDRIVGMVYCARHSKGGHLENLAVDPDYRGLGLADRLVKTLIRDTPEVVTLTTRIPKYFECFGFAAAERLEDGSVFMIGSNLAARLAETET